VLGPHLQEQSLESVSPTTQSESHTSICALSVQGAASDRSSGVSDGHIDEGGPQLSLSVPPLRRLAQSEKWMLTRYDVFYA
jgi:hypothetical protein